MKKLSAMDTVRDMLDRGPCTPAELAEKAGVSISEVNTLIKISQMPVRMVNGSWKRTDGKRRPRQRGEPLIRTPETNGIGGSHAVL